MKTAYINKCLQTLVVLLMAAAMKAFYSTANVNDLRWILSPTTFFVELITGEDFHFESHAGYVNSDFSYLIAGSCSGMNFFIMAFLMLTTLLIWHDRSRPTSWWSIPICFLIAYCVTIIANSVRIALSVKVHRMDAMSIWMNPDQAHRLQGISIYFGFLLLIFVIVERVRRSEMASRMWRYVIPLAMYWLMTLGIPIWNGEFEKNIDFREHIIFVTLTPIIIVTPLIFLEVAKQGKRRRLR